MTEPVAGLHEIISRSHHLFLDFDGPICSIFAAIPASKIVQNLRHALEVAGIVLPAESEAEDDPLELFRIAAGLGPDVAELAQRELTSLEMQAVAHAQPTPGATRLITTATQTGRTIAIISNNSGQAITAYLADHRLLGHVSSVFGRNDPDPAHMKPSSYRVRHAVGILRASPRHSALIGDSASDITAAHGADIAAIGYASKPGKAQELADAGADAVTANLSHLTAALRSALPS